MFGDQKSGHCVGRELSARGVDRPPGIRVAVLAEFHEGKEVVALGGWSG